VEQLMTATGKEKIESSSDNQLALCMGTVVLAAQQHKSDNRELEKKTIINCGGTVTLQ